MVTRDEAFRIACAYVQERSRQTAQSQGSNRGCEFEITYEQEQEFGWVFGYQSKDYIKTGDPRDALYGNAPVIVDRDDGSLHTTGTGFALAHYLEQYRRRKANLAAIHQGRGDIQAGRFISHEEMKKQVASWNAK